AAESQGDHLGRTGIDECADGSLLIVALRKLPADEVLQFPETWLDEMYAALGSGLAQRVAGCVENELHPFAPGNAGDVHVVIVRDATGQAAACDEVTAFDLFQSGQASLPLRWLEDRTLRDKPELESARLLVHRIADPRVAHDGDAAAFNPGVAHQLIEHE